MLVHGLTKEGKVPDADIARAIQRKLALELDPESHIYKESDSGEEDQ